MLEELADLEVAGAKYDAYKSDIMEGDQFGSDFVSINPNSKIPALVDYSESDNPIKLFESGDFAMLAEKFIWPASVRVNILIVMVMWQWACPV